MRVLIDTSAVIALLLNEDLNRSIVGMTQGADVVSASSLPWEVGNALVANIRKNRINPDQASEANSNFQRMGIRLFDVDLGESISLASKLNIYAYDAFMLCCASNLKLPMLTLDYQMVKNAATIGVKTLEVK